MHVFVLSGNDDLPNVYEIQNQMELVPLSVYGQKDTYTPSQRIYVAENDFVPVEKVLSMTPMEFFSTTNELMVETSPDAADAEILKRIAAIRVGAGMNFDSSLLGENMEEQWRKMLQYLRTILVSDGVNHARKLG